MAKIPEGSEITTGVVIEALANALFRVELDELPKNRTAEEGQEGKPAFIAQLGGKMRLHRIRIIVGDRVELLFDQYGGKPRIIRRL
ncbi:MAG: hypothetical protein AMXMBFR44_3800 [Candidatus Campbellbacteria bacterium]